VTSDDVKIGTRVIDITNGQHGVVVNRHKPANPNNIESGGLVAIRVGTNAIVWSSVRDLEQHT
jgi:hypothetical protein